MKLNPLLILLFVCLGSGCEEDVIGVLGTERAYSMYGVLNPFTDTQYVRVFPIEGTLESGSSSPLPIQFESLNLTTGTRIVWSDSVVRDHGGYGHIFLAPFRVAYEHQYKISIVGEDQRYAEVTVEVPPKTEAELGQPAVGSTVSLPVRFKGNIPRILVTELSFFTQYTVATASTGTRILQSDTVTVAFDSPITRSPTGLLLLVNLSEAARISKTEAGNNPDYDERFGVELLYIKLKTIVANEAWNPPGGSFDPLVLIQPGIMSNVENGFGFVGAGYELELRWQPSKEVMQSAGFTSFL